MVSKRMQRALEAVNKERLSIGAALEEAKRLSEDKEMGAKFTESMDVVMRLGIPVGESVRGSVCPEHGLGKDVKVAVFAKGEAAIAAEKAGAEFVGAEDLAEKFTKDEISADVVIASPDMMSVVGKLGRVLGPKGLMPNPKVGTVSPDVANAVNNAKKGQIFFRTDKSGAIYARVGPVSFTVDQLTDNVKLMVAEIKRLKPARAKGAYIRSFYVNTTMGPGVEVDPHSLD